MLLPNYVTACIDALENAGFPTYAVGGCVRDQLLGLTPQDYDLCTAATPSEIRRVFAPAPLVLAGEKHGTVGVITENGVVEITTFRAEGDYQDSRHPEWVRFVSHIEEDLCRRDFTINAMAYSPSQGFADPFGGRADLRNRILRTVGDPNARFQEDALRILRGVRFSIRYGLTPEAQTMSAMAALSPLLDNLARERVFDELCKLLPLASTEDLLRFAPILGEAIPELVPTFAFDQRSPHHAYDLFTHIAHVTAAVPSELSLRWAALLHDIGKPLAFTQDETGRGHFLGHAKLGSELAGSILLRLKAPTALRDRVVFLISHHMTPLEPDRKLLRRRLSQYGMEATEQLLALQQADFSSKGTGRNNAAPDFPQITAILREIQDESVCLTLRDLAISGKDLLALGFAPGKDLGACLEYLLARVLDESLPNDRDILLAEAQKRLS